MSHQSGGVSTALDTGQSGGIERTLMEVLEYESKTAKRYGRRPTEHGDHD